MRAHDGVVAEDAAEIVGIGKHVFLQREKHAGGIDEIEGRNAIFERDGLRAQNLLRRHGEEGAGFDGGVVGDDHAEASGRRGPVPVTTPAAGAPPYSAYMPWAAQRPSSRKSVPGIEEEVEPFAGREALFGVLGFDGFGAAALADRVFFGAHAGEKGHESRTVRLQARGLRVECGGQSVVKGLRHGGPIDGWPSLAFWGRVGQRCRSRESDGEQDNREPLWLRQGETFDSLRALRIRRGTLECSLQAQRATWPAVFS